MIKRSEMRKNWIYMFLTLVISFLIISLFVFDEGRNNINDLSEDFREFYISEQKLEIKNEVDSRYDEITYMLDHLQMDYNELVKNKILILAETMRRQSFVDGLACEDQRICFIEAFEEFVRDDDYLYFVLSPEGVLLKSGTDVGIEGVNIIDNVDIEGIYYVREMIKAVDNPEGIYVTYHWPKVKDGEPLKKTSYCYYLEEYDLIIGTGAYDEDIQKELKDSTFNKLLSYFDGQENYVFINDYNGITKVHGNLSAVGNDFSRYVDVNGLNVHNAFMDISKNNGSGYVNYYIKEEISGKNSGNISEKISYVRRIDDWEVYIGMGFHTDPLVNATGSFIEEFNAKHSVATIRTIAMLLSTALIVLYLVRRGSVMQKGYMKQEDVIYEQVLNMANDLIIVLNKKGKIVFNNKEVPEDVDIEACLKGDKRVIDVVKENIHAIHGSKNIYYVELKENDFYYQGEDATIYYIKDITQQYKKTNVMEALALHDELTGLANRRKFTKDMGEVCQEGCEGCSLILAAIDIDHFKLINDTYGHDVGDQVLRSFADYVVSQLREEDNIYRYGGEEFVFIFRGFTLQGAQDRLESINKGFTLMMKETKDIHLTFSGGVVYCRSNQDKSDIEERLIIADKLLYQAKEQGRNRIIGEED